jgi:hypothetical protein
MTTESGIYPTSLTEQNYNELIGVPTADLLEHTKDLEAEVAAWNNLYSDGTRVLTPGEEACLTYMKMWLNAYYSEIDRRDEKKEFKDMTDEELAEAYQDIFDERKYFSRARRGKIWTDEDDATYESMNAIALAITEEQGYRRKKKQT